ncbi:MAG: ABC transporter permease subunit [Bifidobacteriaceae bacterium]|jgi:NitT/TauT family transport system permease protein|nr:ABC transporter permease subunit [Bifidobacteriaceae bacterium]
MFSDKKQRFWRIVGVLFWLGFWQALSFVPSFYIQVSPITVFGEFWNLLNWQTLNIVLYTCFLVLSGFIMAFLFGAVLAYLAFRFMTVKILVEPLIGFCRSTPVVVIIMALLLYFTPEFVGIIIVIITVCPIVFINTSSSFAHLDKELDEVADVFGCSPFMRLTKVHLPQILPELFASANIGIGFAFKSAIAAQVIAITNGSVGEQIYYAKLYIDTNLLLAWVLIVLLVGAILQALVKLIFDYLIIHY